MNSQSFLKACCVGAVMLLTTGCGALGGGSSSSSNDDYVTRTEVDSMLCDYFKAAFDGFQCPGG